MKISYSKCALLLLLLLFPFLGLSQANEKLNVDLKLRLDLILGNKVVPGNDYILSDGYFADIEIKDNPLFERIKFEYNQAGELVSYTCYGNSKTNTVQNRQKIISCIEKYYGKADASHISKDKTSWSYKKGEDYVSFWTDSLGYDLSISTDRLIKAVKKYSPYEKTTVIDATGFINDRFEDFIGTEETGERHFWFRGLADKNKIVMHYTMIPKSQSKNIIICLDDSITIPVEPTQTSISNWQRSSAFDLPRDLADKIYSCSKMTITTKGKHPDTVEVTRVMLKSFHVVYNALYNQKY